jgi:hypothetical protein
MGDVDRRKHDVDVIERVLGSLRETADRYTPLMDVETPWLGGSTHSTVEMTVGLPSASGARASASEHYGSGGNDRRDRR